MVRVLALRWTRSAALVCAVLAPTLAYGVQFAADVTVGTVSVQLKRVNTISGSQNANPLFGTYAPGDSSRLYLIQQGTVDANPDIQAKLLYINPSVVDSPVNTLVDLSVKLPGFVDITHFEKGLLAVAFHPDFNNPAKPGYLKFYTYTTENYAASAAAYGATLDYKHPETAASLPIPPNPLPQNWINNVNTLREWTANSTTPTDATPSRVLMRIADPQNQHNGGTLAFSPVDCYMYWSLGDGGGNSSTSPEFDASKGGINSTTDGHTNMVVNGATILPHGNSQDRTVPLGKFLRINPLADVGDAHDPNAAPSANGQYQIPKDNPFTMESNIDPNTMAPYPDWNPAWVDEIYAYGVRNPYRFSIDRGDGGANLDRGKIYLADPGWDDREEIDIIEKGKNYGWVIREGTQNMAGTFAGTANEIPSYTAPVNPVTGLPDTLTDPIAEYHESVGHAIIGGFVSRQSSTNGLFGKYVFGDYQSPLSSPSGNAMLFYFDTNEVKAVDAPYRIFRLGISGSPGLPSGVDLLGMGEGANGAIYAMFDNGQIYELVPQAIALPGDYDNNHVVDAADYALWRKNVGTDNILVNDATGGTIGDDQYNQWRANFGKTIATGGTGAALVPEPSFASLLLIAASAGVLAARLGGRRVSR
jgi:Glucose / Sorbosone dehydrogenase